MNEEKQTEMTEPEELKPEALLNMLEDLEEAKKRLQESEERFRKFFESDPDMSFIVTKNGIITEANTTAIQQLGHKMEELAGKDIFSFCTPETGKDHKTLLKKCMRLGGIRNEGVNLMSKGGKRYSALLSAEHVKNERGEVLYHLMVFRDITEIVKAQASLKISEAKLRSLVNSSPDCIKMFDLKGKLLYLSPGGLREHMLKEEKEAVGLNYLSTVISGQRPYFRKAIRDAAKGKTSTMEIMHVPGKATREWCLMTIAPIKDEKGKVSGIFGVSRDISQIKEAEAKLREEKEILQKSLSVVSGIMVALNPRGEIILLNKRGCEILGVRKGSAIGKNWFDRFIPARNRKSVKSVFRSLMAGKARLVKHYANTVITARGREKIVAWHNTILRNDRGKIIATLSAGKVMKKKK